MTQIENLNHGDSYRTIKYGDKWYAEKLKNTGVWEILGSYSSEEDAAKRISDHIMEARDGNA